MLSASFLTKSKSTHVRFLDESWPCECGWVFDGLATGSGWTPPLGVVLEMNEWTIQSCSFCIFTTRPLFPLFPAFPLLSVCLCRPTELRCRAYKWLTSAPYMHAGYFDIQQFMSVRKSKWFGQAPWHCIHNMVHGADYRQQKGFSAYCSKPSFIPFSYLLSVAMLIKSPFSRRDL